MKIQVNARNRAHQFDAAPADKILYAGLSQAIALPYECGSGTCGTCKARRLSGDIEDGWPEAPGRKYLKSPDEFLMCQCTARGDVSVEVASFVQEFEPGVCVPAAVEGRIRDATLLTHDVMQLHIDLATPLEFDAGQFVLVQVPGIVGFRGWSMVNYERNALTLVFVVKKKPGGQLSDWLFSQPRAGTDVEVFGPLGRATFYPSVARNILCIAGGSGIAGMMSILARAARENYFTEYRGDVFFGVRSMKDAFFLDVFSRLREQCGEKLRVTIALSEEGPPACAQADHPQLEFDTGFVHDVAERRMKGRYEGVRAYLAGPPPAVDACVRMLLMSRVSTDNIRYDKFS
ncbi:2Fe-2S iron-sulfur cluster-binding protein [Methylibium sp.]|uniref:2Fe-2S iron-sulfur cluster-binding protein n=1 Tax=Methylibium sp. TaxID=2067992 RepID=UPI003D0AE2B4